MNGMTERTLHLSQSVAKSVTASVAGVLIGEGRMDPDAPVTDYLPELKATAYKGAKLQHLLDMTSGVAFGEEYTDRFSDIGMTDVGSGWKPVPAEKPPRGEWFKSIWDQVLSLKTKEVEHGTRFRYRSIETDVLAFAMERATGRRLADLVSTYLWQPMGAAESACFTVDRSGYALADGGLNATLRDYARFGLVHLGLGTFNGRRILPAEWVADTRRGAHGLFNDDSRAVMPNGVYRNQFWVRDRGKETTMARGVFGQLVYIAPEDDLVVGETVELPHVHEPRVGPRYACRHRCHRAGIDVSQFLLEHVAAIRIGAMLSVLAIMTLWELAAPFRTQRFSRARRWPSNFGVLILDSIVTRLIIPFSLAEFASWQMAAGTGLFNWLAWPGWITIPLAIAALDLIIYGQHIVFHHVPALWRLHRMHHSDLEFDVTTGLRFHPVEIVLSVFLKMAAIVVLGAPPEAVLIFEVLLNASSMFSHSNISLPGWLDRWARRLIVTPDMHRVHHSVAMEETNSNFGFNLSLWDRVFGTYRPQPKLGQHGMTIGVDGLQAEGELRLDHMLTQPFRG